MGRGGSSGRSSGSCGGCGGQLLAAACGVAASGGTVRVDRRLRLGIGTEDVAGARVEEVVRDRGHRGGYVLVALVDGDDLLLVGREERRGAEAEALGLWGVWGGVILGVSVMKVLGIVTWLFVVWCCALSRIIGDTKWQLWSLFKALLLRLHVEVAIVR